MRFLTHLSPRVGGCWLLRLAVVALAAAGVWAAGLVWYVGKMPLVPVAPATVSADAIVVLTGGSERLKAGLDLLGAGRAGVLFVTGVGQNTSLDALLRDQGPVPAAMRRKIVLGHLAGDTIGNAVETARWARVNGVRSLIVVTADYHMPRSLLEFRLALPGLRLIPYPVFPPAVRRVGWWHHLGTLALFAGEFSKYLLVRMDLVRPDASGAFAING